MLHVDISNIWGEISLQDLLGIEQEIFAAHNTVPEWGPGAETDRIQKAADRIRQQSRVCVVLGTDNSGTGARAVMELLQGPNRNLLEDGPQLFFWGSSLSTRQWNEGKELLEGKDFSLIVVSRGEMNRGCAAALRGLKWILERKYGTDESCRRIFAVTDSPESTLGQMAANQGWETFLAEKSSVLSPEGLLPMAVAGIDLPALMDAAAAARQEFDLRSFENPLWLYVAVRRLMGRCGKRTEYLVSWEPGFRSLGQWWQQLFLDCGDGPVPAVLEFPGARAAAQGSHFFETVIRFAPDDHPHIIGYDVCDLDGLNEFADLTLDALEERDYLDTLEAHGDKGIPFITLECGGLDAETAGQLLAFLELARSVSCAGSEGAGEEAD